ncbi:unnamed protein product [Sphagnum troendelagicum]
MAISMLAKTVPRGMITNGKVARIQFSVKDNGTRISAEDQVKLFEPYSFVTSGWVSKKQVFQDWDSAWPSDTLREWVELLVLNPQRGKEALFSSLYLSLLCPLIQA